MRYFAQRMMTGCEWGVVFQFLTDVNGVPYPLDISLWTIAGVCRRTNFIDNTFPLQLGDRLSFGTMGQLIIQLSAADTTFLDVGNISFELFRTDPPPYRPILKFFIQNYQSTLAPYSVMPVPAMKKYA